jgi:hypothetical protein
MALDQSTLSTLIKKTVSIRIAATILVGKFKVSEEAKEFLRTIKERVGVISVAGKYRTGKSFLLNRVIINKDN